MDKIINYIKTLSDNEKIQKLLIETVGKVLLKQKNYDSFIEKNQDKINHIRDWIISIVENNEQLATQRVFTIEALNNAANKYFQKKNQKIQIIKLDEIHEKLVANLGDYYIVQMLTPQALDNESKFMQHCIGHGGYDQNLDKKEYRYLSLRDRFNKAHCTLEIKNNEVLQLQGKQNDIPDEKYLFAILPWLMKNNYKIDLSYYNIYYNKNDNKIYSVYNLPDNCEIDGNINLYNDKKIKLPNNLIINGNLFLNNCSLFKNKLPDGLVIRGNLDLISIDIEELPNDIKIEKELSLLNMNIRKIPDNLDVKFLYLNSCDFINSLPENLILDVLSIYNCENINHLPKKLYVKKELTLFETYINQLPEDIKIDDYIDLSLSHIERLPDNLIVNRLNLNRCVNIKELPNHLVVNGELDLQNTNITEIPKNAKINSSIYLRDSKIKKLPDNFIVNNLFDLYWCKEMKELPNGLIVNNDLHIGESNIEKLGENITINGSFHLYKSQLKSLPNNMKISKNLYLSESEITEIPDSLNISGDIDIRNSKIEKLPNNLRCNIINIEEEQINLIKRTMEFKIVLIGYKQYTKKQFFKTFPNKENYFLKIANLFTK